VDDLGVVILFTISLALPGKEPILFSYPVATLEECLFEVGEFARHPSREALIQGGTVWPGCSLKLRKSEEH
jgi:hypothetical protein